MVVASATVNRVMKQDKMPIREFTQLESVGPLPPAAAKGRIFSVEYGT